MPSTYAVTIGGVAKTIQPGWRISETANGRNTFSFRVLSLDGLFRAAIDDPVVFTEDGTRIYGGLIDRPVESGFGGVGSTSAIVQNVSAVDFTIYAFRIGLTAEIPAGTFEAALTVVATALSAQGVTLAVGQVTGPALPALSYTDRQINEVLDEICALAGGAGATSYLWDIDYNKVLEGWEAGTRSAPFTVADGDGNVDGDITVEQARSGDYANYVTVRGGEGQRYIEFEPHNGNGVVRRFALDVPVANLVGALRIDGGAGGLPVGIYGVDDMPWTFDASTNEIVQRADQAVIAVGHYVEMSYNGRYPVSRFADGGVAVANRVMRTYTEPDVFNVVVLQALADSYVIRDMASPKTVRYGAIFSKVGLHPGQVQTITSAKRNLSGSHLFTDVQILHVAGQLAQRQVTAVSTTRLPATLRETFKRVFGGGSSGSGSVGGGSVTIISSGGVGGAGTAGKLAQWTAAAVLGDGPLASAVLLSTGGYADPAWVTSLAATKLTGTIASGVQDTITRLGTITSGVWNAGAVTSSGVIRSTSASGWAMGSVAGVPRITYDSGAFGLLTETDSYASLALLNATVNGTLAVNGVASLPGGVGSSLIPTTTDTYDLGRYDKLWGQSFISTMNALVFAQSTQLLFGGYSTIGKNAGSFAADVAAAATTINFGAAMTVGNWILVRAHDTGGTVKAEYLTVGTLVSGTTYNVTRDLAAAHGTDPGWASGTPFLVLGASGDGRIDMLAYDGKPRIIFTLQGATYNAQSERAVIGDLNGYFGYASSLYGAAFGNPSGAWIKIDPTNGIRIGHNTTTKISLDASGNASFTGSVTVTGGDAATQTYAAGVASTAQSNAISTASGDATTKANSAQSTAISTASGDATTKANNAAAASLDKTTYLTASTTTIAGGMITTGTVTAAKLAADLVVANLIRSSGATAFGTGTGFWLDASTPTFRVGNPAGNRLSWDGSTLVVRSGTLIVDGSASGHVGIGASPYSVATLNLASDGNTSASISLLCSSANGANVSLVCYGDGSVYLGSLIYVMPGTWSYIDPATSVQWNNAGLTAVGPFGSTIKPGFMRIYINTGSAYYQGWIPVYLG